MSYPPLAPLLRCHCSLKSGSVTTELEGDLPAPLTKAEKLFCRLTWARGSCASSERAASAKMESHVGRPCEGGGREEIGGGR